MNTRLAALAAAVMLGVAAPASSALAYSFMGSQTRSAPAPTTYDALGPAPVGAYEAGRQGWCERSSASEGNANQQSRPVKQYGQTSGGYAC